MAPEATTTSSASATSLASGLNLTSNISQSIYVIEPHPDPGLAACHGFNLRIDFENLMVWKFWIAGVVSSILIIGGCLGNSMAMFILRKPKMRSAFNQLLIILCIIDTIFLLSNVPTTVVALGSRLLNPINPYFSIAGHISMCASVLMIVALSHERYFAICSPHAYRIHMRTVSRWKHLAKYIAPVILVSVICNIPMFINLQKEILKNSLYVKINLYLRGVHPLSTTGLLPMVYLIFANIRICQGIKKLRKPKIVRARQNSLSSTTAGGAAENNVIAQRTLNGPQLTNKNKRHFKEIRTTYLAIGIVITFAVLNFPRFIASTIEVVNTNLIIKCVENGARYVPSYNFYKLDFFARMLMVLNSAINFIIYCAVSTPFKEAFVEHICPCFKIMKNWMNDNKAASSPQVIIATEEGQDDQDEDEDDDDDDESPPDHQIECQEIKGGEEFQEADNHQPLSIAVVIVQKNNENNTRNLICSSNGSSTMV